VILTLTADICVYFSALLEPGVSGGQNFMWVYQLSKLRYVKSWIRSLYR